ncbi:MAG: deoxyribodipyrimidine photo-lyase [Saprospiraceae bacterium]|nr:deoxyribodipyrimidine photo-lyase [Saprospiraceae bacterium]
MLATIHRPLINIVWFKRDLRLRDHEPLMLAQRAGLPTTLVVFEPSVMTAPQYDERHWRFVQQSLVDMNRQLQPFSASVAVFQEEVIQVLEASLAQFEVRTIFSYRETGLKITYDRDKAVANFCAANQIKWQECECNAVQRGLRSRKRWREHWYEFMAAPQHRVDWAKWRAAPLADIPSLRVLESLALPPNPNFQPGGETYGPQLFQSFLNDRIRHYAKSISKPQESRRGCSRLSPYSLGAT